jgi:hypothetical protein
MGGDQRPVLLLVGASSDEPMPVLVKHSGLRMVAVNKDSIRLLDDTWDVLGVYFLFGHGSEPDRFAAYIGEASRRPLRTRLREHVRNKDQWNREEMTKRIRETRARARDIIGKLGYPSP